MKRLNIMAAVAAAVVIAGQGAALAASKPAQGPTAFLKSTGQEFSGATVSVQPGTVDGKSYHSFWRRKAEIEVPAGNRVVHLNIDIRFSGWEDPYHGYIPFRAKLVPGRHYHTAGRVNGRYVDVWIADVQTGKLASKVLSIFAEKCETLRPFCPRPRLAVKSEL